MKIYDFPMAPNPRRVRIFLAEKKIEMVYVHVDIFKGENRTVEFIQKNPLGGLPVLEFDDGTYLTESVAICRYFEGIQPNPPLMGVDPRDIAFVEMWNRRMELELLSPITNFTSSTRIQPSHADKADSGIRRNAPRSWDATAGMARLDAGATAVHRGRSLYDRGHHRAGRDRYQRRHGRLYNPSRCTAPEALARGGVESAQRQSVMPAAPLSKRCRVRMAHGIAALRCERRKDASAPAREPYVHRELRRAPLRTVS